MRAIAGIVIGVIAGAIVAIVVGMVALPMTYTLPSGLNPNDANQVVRALTGIPPTTQIALAVAWLASAFCGSFVAKLIARRSWAAWAVTLVVTVYFALNAFVLAQPLWVAAMWTLACLLGGLIGNRLVSGAAPETAALEA